jgi:Rod binding domain-containing protein
MDLALTSDGSLRNLKAGDPRSLERATKQFEGLFLSMMMPKQEDSIAGGDAILGDSPGLRQWNEMLQSALIERSAGGLGIGAMLVKRYSSAGAAASGSTPTPKGGAQ